MIFLYGHKTKTRHDDIVAASETLAGLFSSARVLIQASRESNQLQNYICSKETRLILHILIPKPV